MKPKEVVNPNFLLKQAASFIPFTKYRYGFASLVFQCGEFASRRLPFARKTHSLLSRTPNHWRMGTFIGCYENVRARVISLSAVTMPIPLLPIAPTFVAAIRQARGAHSAGILETRPRALRCTACMWIEPAFP